MNNSREALVLFYEKHQGILTLYMHLEWGFQYGGKRDCVMLHCFRDNLQCQQVFTTEI